MKILTIVLLALCTVLSFSNVVYGATSEVTWTDYEKYRDIRPANGHRKHFRESTFYNFEKHFTKLAKMLPEGQVLKIDVTDVDLAGDTNAGGIDRIRIVKNVYFPRINLSYQLLNTDGSELEAGEVKLKDMNFMTTSRLKYRNQSLGYEKNMIDDWFFSLFKDQLVLKK